MNSFGPLVIFAIGATALFLYRLHKLKLDYESVCSSYCKAYVRLALLKPYPTPIAQLIRPGPSSVDWHFSLHGKV